MTPAVKRLADVSILDFRERGAAWLKGKEFKFPRELFETLRADNGPVTLCVDGMSASYSLESLTPQVRHAWVASLRDRCLMTDDPPASSMLPVSYQVVPPLIRTAVARTIGRWKRRSMNAWAYFPSFPLDLSTDALADLLAVPRGRFHPTPVLLTHDIDSPEGLSNLPLFLDVEETSGARSTNFVVPCAWRIDHGLLASVLARGHEIGVHGFNHGNKTPFMDEGSIHRRLIRSREFMERYRVRGYRAPSLLRTRTLMRELSRFFAYDSSIPTSGGLFPVPNNGCASATPFFVEGIREIPLSLPRDGSLLFLGYSAEQIRDVWLSTADLISGGGGIVVLLTHCERRFSGNRGMLESYRQVVEHFSADDRFVFMTCSELAASIGTAPAS